MAASPLSPASTPRDDAAPASRFGALSYPNYRLFWLANVARVFGLQFRFIGAGWLTHLLDPSPVWLGVVGLAAAVPTAYTGGSGAFVMAAGALIYHEVRIAGASHAYALGATAMSGSLGVVLNPSLVILSIAAVNKEVTSDEIGRAHV